MRIRNISKRTVIIFTSTEDIHGYQLMPEESVATSHEIAVLSDADVASLQPEGEEGEKLKVIVRPTSH
jgi:hypothetical protein